MGPLQLSTAQSFEVERFSRAIDQTQDVGQLREIAKQLLQAWQSQKAATQWVMKQGLSSRPWVTPEMVMGEQQKGGPEPPSAM